MAAYFQQVGRVVQDLTIKVQVGDDTRVVSLNPNGTYEELMVKVRQAFPETFIANKQVFKYEDAAKDTITVYDTQSLLIARRGGKQLKLCATGGNLTADHVQDLRKQLFGLKEYVCGEVDRMLQLLDSNVSLSPEAATEEPALFGLGGGENIFPTPAADSSRPAWHVSTDINDGMHRFHQTRCKGPDFRQARETHIRYMNDVIETGLKRLGRYARLEQADYGFKVGDKAIMEFEVLVLMKGRELQASAVKPGYVTLMPLPGKAPQFQDVVDMNIQVSGERLSTLLFTDLQTLVNGNRDLKEKAVLKRVASMVQMDVNKPDGSLWFCVNLTPAYDIPGREGMERYVPQALKDRMVPTWFRTYTSEIQKLIGDMDQRDGGCRSQCLDFLKFLCARRPRFRVLNPYRMKTLVLYESKEKPSAQMWDQTKFGVRVLDLIERMSVALRDKCLAHYFIPELNLMEGLADQPRTGLCNRCKELYNKQQAFKNFIDMGK